MPLQKRKGIRMYLLMLSSCLAYNVLSLDHFTVGYLDAVGLSDCEV